MKTLLVLRHAKASQDSPSGRDVDRKLSPRGRRQAHALGGMMRERKLAIDAIVASPAVRVVETVTGLTEGSGESIEPKYDRRLYNASPESLLAVIGAVDDKVKRLLVVGHNPGLHDLVLRLADTDGGALRAQIASSYPTATLAELQLPIERWQDIAPHCGRLASLIRPED